MYLLTLKDGKADGAYAVQDRHGHKVLFLFERGHKKNLPPARVKSQLHHARDVYAVCGF